MNTLTVRDIFQNFSFYQQHYHSILADPQQYQTIVENAVLDVWPFSSKNLYLGDLLQLWFSQKWLINQPCHIAHNQAIQDLLEPLFQRDDLYLYELHGNAFLGKAVAKVWSVSEQREIDLILESSLQYYSTYRTVA